ncbi:hypothetical protein AXG93_2062s1120 [Marchantia polymorpha subsp. ruderalis]|uniref:LRAT domain-containing protein n=1 Tax=Marchantia polymorpha subsp. ruderalis TaxID=1480154 RepID=A0A176VFL6_MARPO|nr:hypothetical protein AXG93_2062s1120 [Marchantia polymorpha subsp. ruderalis]
MELGAAPPRGIANIYSLGLLDAIRYKYVAFDTTGIYIGDGKVIHFLDNSEAAGGNGEGPGSIFRGFSSSSASTSKSRCEECGTNKKGGVQMTCLNCFLKGDSLRLFFYGVSKAELALSLRGGCSGMKAEEPEQVLHRANYLLRTDGFGTYNLQTHNCEDFAIYCKTGIIDLKNGTSKQVELVRQVGKFGAQFLGKKSSNLIGVFQKLKTHLVDERWERDSVGCHIAVEELVKMYTRGIR